MGAIARWNAFTAERRAAESRLDSDSRGDGPSRAHADWPDDHAATLRDAYAAAARASDASAELAAGPCAARWSRAFDAAFAATAELERAARESDAVAVAYLAAGHSESAAFARAVAAKLRAWASEWRLVYRQLSA